MLITQVHTDFQPNKQPITRSNLIGGGFNFKRVPRSKSAMRHPGTSKQNNLDSEQKPLSRKMTEQEQLSAFKQLVDVGCQPAHTTSGKSIILKKQSFQEDFLKLEEA